MCSTGKPRWGVKCRGGLVRLSALSPAFLETLGSAGQLTCLVQDRDEAEKLCLVARLSEGYGWLNITLVNSEPA